ncbi:hypothetical protein GUJ93_ZPchr0002g24424 [Zizania palustris]|uniref:Uncharacterized protein n=1 Tax=Zizania palustris TaxID=103762 RepID=A0A8J5RPF4_ZIZPA|nr:hypothetical protein GUJ93_ZPchr0002g24424 [Zizania palustris]
MRPRRDPANHGSTTPVPGAPRDEKNTPPDKFGGDALDMDNFYHLVLGKPITRRSATSLGVVLLRELLPRRVTVAGCNVVHLALGAEVLRCCQYHCSTVVIHHQQD